MNISLRNVVEVPIHIPSKSPTTDNDPRGESIPTTPDYTHGKASSIPFPAASDSPCHLFDWANELRAWQAVLGCKEAMWEELEKKTKEDRDIKETGEDLLRSLPWSKEERELRPRQLFELLFLRYEREMRKCISISTALRKRLGWSAGKHEHEYGVFDENFDWLDRESRYASITNCLCHSPQFGSISRLDVFERRHLQPRDSPIALVVNRATIGMPNTSTIKISIYASRLSVTIPQ